MDKTAPSEKTLIVYLTRTGNTRAVANMIHEELGGTIIGLELKTPYPEDYQEQVDQVVKENASGYLPPLKTVIGAIQDYENIFLGAPTWGMQLPPPMKSFLNEYDLTGKVVIPFNTNAGYGMGSSFEEVKKLCPNAEVLEGFSVKGGKERDGILFVMEGDKEAQVRKSVQAWLKNISLQLR
jgi:flavodoxin